MEDIELVIKIPKAYYENLLKNCRFSSEEIPIVSLAIATGKPLDLEGLKSDMKALNCGFPYGLDYLLDCLDKRLGITIIEADKAESEET